MVPTPSQDCGPQQITIPTVQCEDITEERYKNSFLLCFCSKSTICRCVQLPAVKETEVEAQQCTVPLGEPSCNQVDPPPSYARAAQYVSLNLILCFRLTQPSPCKYAENWCMEMLTSQSQRTTQLFHHQGIVHRIGSNQGDTVVIFISFICYFSTRFSVLFIKIFFNCFCS